MFVPFAGYFHHTSEVTLYLCYLCLYLCYEFVCLIFRELQYALHLYFHEAQYVVLGHLAHQLRVIWCQSLVDMLAGSIYRLSVLVFLVLIYTFLDEYLLQRTEEELFEQLSAANLKFAPQQIFRLLCTCSQHIADGHELRFLVFYDTAVW